jgi:hypothetical protein
MSYFFGMAGVSLALVLASMDKAFNNIKIVEQPTVPPRLELELVVLAYGNPKLL